MESLQQLAHNVEQLLNQYQELKSQLESLQVENKIQREEIIKTHEELQKLKKDYSQLHTAHTLLLGKQASDEDRAKAKQKITNIILQIDKAIETLTQ
jgi:predicted nuclease with TOPRIM domain